MSDDKQVLSAYASQRRYYRRACLAKRRFEGLEETLLSLAACLRLAGVDVPEIGDKDFYRKVAALVLSRNRKIVEHMFGKSHVERSVREMLLLADSKQ